jgi:hypothetical protein
VLFRAGASSGLGCGVRNAGFSRAPGRRGTCHRFHDCTGAPTCSRRKRGNQKQEALGRSCGGFSTKIHLRTNANGEPLTFDVTGGEAHEVKGYEALIVIAESSSRAPSGLATANVPKRKLHVVSSEQALNDLELISHHLAIRRYRRASVRSLRQL